MGGTDNLVPAGHIKTDQLIRVVGKFVGKNASGGRKGFDITSLHQVSGGKRDQKSQKNKKLKTERHQ